MFFQNALPSLTEIYAKQVLGLVSYIAGIKESVETRKVLMM